MAVTHPTAVRNSACDHILGQPNEGTPPRRITFQTFADVTLVQCNFSNTAFGSASGERPPRIQFRTGL